MTTPLAPAPGPPDPDVPDPLALPDYVPGSQVGLSDAERWPGLSPTGRARLRALETDPAAPPWVHRTGHRLTPDEQERARRQLPTDGWLEPHLARARELPAYLRHAGPLERLEDFPLVGRPDLVDDVAAYVPMDADLSRVLHGTSSGTTGAALVVPDDPDELARGLHWLRGLVEQAGGVPWEPVADRMAVAQVVHQRQAFTYTSVLPGFGESVMARLNLHPDAWPREHCVEFLARWRPQVVSGHPTSLEQLLDPAVVQALRPAGVLGLVSGAMALSLPLRRALEQTYACPVLDVYGLHETRPIAVSPDGGPHVVADRRVHVEVLDPAGRPVPEGEPGEIVVTAGENAFLPLVRYRTGDHGRLVRLPDGRSAIADLEGRAATVFRSTSGAVVPSVDLTQQLQAAGATGWSVEQTRSGAVTATVVGGDTARVGEALGHLLGRAVAVRQVASLADLGEGKPRRYRSDA